MAYEPKRLEIDLNGQWATSVDASRIGPQNYAKLVNMRYAPGGGLKAVSGFSRINSQPISTGLENFAADYSETDTAGDRLSVSPNTVSFTGLYALEAVAVTRDFGEGYFAGSFEHKFSFCMTDGADVDLSHGGICLWTLVNSTGKTNDQLRYTDLESYLALDATLINMTPWGYGRKIVLILLRQGGGVGGAIELDLGVRYYIRIRFDATYGDYGRATVSIFTDSDYTVPFAGQVPEFSDVLAEPLSFRYLVVASDDGD